MLQLGCLITLNCPLVATPVFADLTMHMQWINLASFFTGLCYF
jgi:hypothetical protein